MKKVAAADVVIFGGGVAGLWLLHRLRQAGYSAVLFESGTLGGGQTSKAQGIIHGGMKYALQGALTKDSQAMSDMPTVWRQCLAGEGEINLSGVSVLSQQHYLWSPHRFTAKLTGLLASVTLSSQVASLPKSEYPSAFQNSAFKGELSALDELVIDVPSLVRELVKANQDAVFKIEPLCGEELRFDEQGKLLSATVYLSGKSIEISAQQFIFAAGTGNEILMHRLPKKVDMQRRPLHMVLVKTPFQHRVYAHCLGLGARPRLTITTHERRDGTQVWYLGGLLAEDGIHRDHDAQVKAAQTELASLFPWLDFSGAEYATFMIDRAEPRQRGGLKPETAVAQTVNNVTIAWPTKLALAPKLAGDILQQIKNANLTPQWHDLRELRAWPMPMVAIPIWEEMFCKNDV